MYEWHTLYFTMRRVMGFLYISGAH